jgi:hypothetical protein
MNNATGDKEEKRRAQLIRISGRYGEEFNLSLEETCL